MRVLFALLTSLAIAPAAMVADMKDFIVKGKRGDYSYAVIANFRADKRLNGKNIAQAAKILRGADTLDDQIETILDIEARGGAQGVLALGRFGTLLYHYRLQRLVGVGRGLLGHGAERTGQQ